MRRSVNAVIRRGEHSGYVGECVELSAITQGATLDGTAANLREAIELAISGEDLAELGLTPNPVIVVKGTALICPCGGTMRPTRT